MDIAVLGTGIDGLLAAHAATREGHHVVIYGDEDEPYIITGANARMVRKEIPGITDEMEPLPIKLRPDEQPPYSMEFLDRFGTDFAEKVFGKDADDYIEQYILSEFADLCNPDFIYAFDASEVYDRLHQLYRDHLVYQWVTPRWYRGKNIRHDHDMVINTLPAPKWCAGSAGMAGHHRFPCVYYWTTNDAPYGPLHSGEIYLCADHRPHYLQANLWGVKTVEWPERFKPPMPMLANGIRPLGMVCDCDRRVYQFHNIGVMANWNHRLHIHESYYLVVEALTEEFDTPKQLDLGI